MLREIQKEWRYGLRNGRFLILLAGFLFFAMLTPVMMKYVVPGVMQAQMPGIAEDTLAQMFHMDQLGCIQSYMGDVLEIGALMAALTLCGLIAQEIKDHTLVLPLCGGKKLVHILSAKFLVFAAALIVILTGALSVDYLYAGLLYRFDIGYASIVSSGLMQGLFMVFLLANLLFFGAVIKKPVAAGLVTLGILYAMSALGGLLKIGSWLPTGLMDAALKLQAVPSPEALKTACITVGLILLLLGAALLQLKRMEWNQRG